MIPAAAQPSIQPAAASARPVARSRVALALAPVAACLVVAVVPAPAGLAPAAWRYFALFVGSSWAPRSALSRRRRRTP